MMGDISTSCYVDIPKIVRSALRESGYDSPDQGFDGNTCAVNTSIDEQSPDIALGVNNSKKTNLALQLKKISMAQEIRT